jgi:hypothetical protein
MKEEIEFSELEELINAGEGDCEDCDDDDCDCDEDYDD